MGFDVFTWVTKHYKKPLGVLLIQFNESLKITQAKHVRNVSLLCVFVDGKPRSL